MGPPGQRDETWFTRIYAEHYGQIVNYGRRRLLDADAAAELAQEVFVVAWRRRGEVPDRCLPWLYGVARRLLANRWRAVRAAPRPVPVADPELLTLASRAGSSTLSAVSPVEGGDGRDGAADLADVRTALDTLSDLDQEILRLVGWEELTVGEAARVLGCTSTAAAVRLHRARRRLIKALAANATVRVPTPAHT